MNLGVINSSFHGSITGGVNSNNVNVSINFPPPPLSSRRKEIAEWMSPLDFSHIHAQALGKRTPGTLEWLIESPQFKDWRNGRGRFLWCPGPSGAGKTVFASFVIDLLQKTYFRDPSSVSAVCHIYCQYSNKLSVHQLFELILKQLILSCPSVGIDKLEKMKHQNRRPPLDEIAAILQSNFSLLPGMFVVVDALDECFSESDRHHLLQRMRAFSDVNILMTSRDLPHIAEDMQGVARLNIHVIDGDVKIHANVQRQRNLRFARMVTKVSSVDVDAEVISKAGGSFLLADRHITHLSEQTTERAFINALDTLPTDAAASHASTIGRINQQSKPDKCLAYIVLSLISYAFRPLKSLELRHAAANLVLDRVAQDDDLADEERIVSICAGLITVNKISTEVGFIHYTVQEHLQEIRQGSEFQSEAEITKSFMRLVRSPGMIARPPNHPLIQYAASSLAYHLRHCENDESVVEMALSLVTDSEILCSNWDPYSRIDVGHSISGVHAIHLVAAFGLTRIGKLLLQQHPQYLNQKDGRERTPLSWAAAGGHLDTVLMLFEAGNVRILPVGAPSLKLVLRKSLDTIKQPTRKKVKIDAKDQDGRTPLFYAAMNGHIKIVEMLLKTGKAEIDVKDLIRTPLFYAAMNGHFDVVKVLLNTGKAEIDTKDQDGRTPLFYAAMNGHFEVVKMLLNTGKAEIDVKDHLNGRTSLLYAAMNGHVEVVKMLVNAGKAEIDVRDQDGRTPLFYAAMNGHFEVVKVLNTGSAEIDVKDLLDGRTPLCYAAMNGHFEVVKVLLDTGKVDVDTTDRWGCSPLGYAQQYDHRHVIQLLEDYYRLRS